MDSLLKQTNVRQSRYDDPDLAFYQYRPIDSSIYSIGIKNLEEAALAREMAEIRLIRLLHDYRGILSGTK